MLPRSQNVHDSQKKSSNIEGTKHERGKESNIPLKDKYMTASAFYATTDKKPLPLRLSPKKGSSVNGQQ